MINELPIIKFDTETRSEVPIDHGRHRYLHGRDAAPICMAWQLADNPIKLWLPGAPVPEPFRRIRDFRFAAFNIQFDQAVLNILGPRYGFHTLPLKHCVDVMAVAARYGLPQGLDKLGKALKVKLGKMSEGTRLKKLFCIPPYHDPKQDKAWHREQYKLFYKYCKRDVGSMGEIMSLLPRETLSDPEQRIWQITADINAYGVPIDTDAVHSINVVVDKYTAQESARIPGITEGAVTTIGQVQKIIAWAATRGVNMPNLQKLTVEMTLEDLRIDVDATLDEEIHKLYNPVIELLELRQKIGGAAVKKFKRLKNMAHDGRIHDNLRYHGAGTGRPTGGGFQFLNLPRAKVEFDKHTETYDVKVEQIIDMFHSGQAIYEVDPLGMAKALVRPMVKAPRNRVIMAADYGSIEYILLMWFAGEKHKVEAFRGGTDPYIQFATKLFHVDYVDVTGDMRQKAKPPVLGSGYMLGWRGLIEYAQGYGVYMTDDEAQFATNTFRNDHPLVVKSWHAVKDAAHNAVKFPRTLQRARIRDTGYDLKTTFQTITDKSGTWWLVLTLPSGRKLYYCAPQMVDGQYGQTIKHKGVHPQKKIWTWVYLNPQRIIENIIQALGRDVMNFGIDQLIPHNYDILAHVYDEVIVEEDEAIAQERFDQMIRLMCRQDDWCKNLPLRADGFIAPRYQKH